VVRTAPTNCEANPSTGLNVSPANCDTATATVVVNNPVDAVNDPSVTVASNNTVVTALNALTNDTLSGIAATTNTNVTPLTTGPLSIDANGIVTVAANTQVVRTASPTNYAKPIHQQD
jgi:hypothetical protein